jgi:hypothetical protein
VKRSAADKIIHTAEVVNRTAVMLKLAAWTVFALVGPLAFLVMRNYLGVTITGAIGLFGVGAWGAGVYRTTDGGVTWKMMGLLGFEVSDLAVDFRNKVAYAGTGSGVYVLRY